MSQGLVIPSLPRTPVVFAAVGAGNDGPSNPVTTDLRTDADVETFLGRPLSPQERIDWKQTPLLLGVALGTRPTSGFSVAIERVEIETGGLLSPQLVVEYAERRPPAAAIVLQVLTMPFVLAGLVEEPFYQAIRFVDVTKR